MENEPSSRQVEPSRFQPDNTADIEPSRADTGQKEDIPITPTLFDLNTGPATADNGESLPVKEGTVLRVDPPENADYKPLPNYETERTVAPGSLMDEAFESIGIEADLSSEEETDDTDADPGGSFTTAAQSEPIVNEISLMATKILEVPQPTASPTVDTEVRPATETAITAAEDEEPLDDVGEDIEPATPEIEDGDEEGEADEPWEQRYRQTAHQPVLEHSTQGRGVLILVGMVAAAVLLAVGAIFALARFGADQFTEPATPIPAAAIASKSGATQTGPTPRIVVIGTPPPATAVSKPTTVASPPPATATGAPASAVSSSQTAAPVGTATAISKAPTSAGPAAAAPAVDALAAVAWDLRLSGAALASIVVTPTPTPPQASGVAGAPTTAASSGSGTVYKVKSGDTLTSIARQYGTTVEAIKTANPTLVNENDIKVGMDIRIPAQR
jgi:LysM repeat protein